MNTPKLDPQAPAFPVVSKSNQHIGTYDFHCGMTIHAHIALEAMKPLLGGLNAIWLLQDGEESGDTAIERRTEIARAACLMADNLIAELNK